MDEWTTQQLSLANFIHHRSSEIIFRNSLLVLLLFRVFDGVNIAIEWDLQQQQIRQIECNLFV